VAQKVSRRGEPLAHVGVPQAVAQHLHGPQQQIVKIERAAFTPGSHHDRLATD